MTLDQLIEHLTIAREEHGGDAPVSILIRNYDHNEFVTIDVDMIRTLTSPTRTLIDLT